MTKEELETEAKILQSENGFGLVDAVMTAIKVNISTEKTIELRGFGTFKVVERKAKLCRNPKTKEEILVPAHLAIVWKASKKFVILDPICHPNGNQ